MDSRQLRYFLAVVEHGSVTRAAESIYVAQPALSQSLRTLESELGVELFTRAPRGMRLTSAGEAFLGPALQVTRSWESAIEAVRRVVLLTGGRIDIAAPADLAVEPLAHMVSRFRSDYPHVLVNVIEAASHQPVINLLRTAQCEIGFDYLPVEDARVATRVLGRRRLVLGLPPGSAEGGSGILSLDVLADLPLVIGTRGGVVREEVERFCDERGFAPRVVVEVDYEHYVYLLVAAGAGAAFLTKEEADRAKRCGVKIVQTVPELGHDYGLLYRADRLAPAVHAFVDVVSRSGGSMGD